MSSKRRIRRKSCDGKHRHDTKQEARTHIYSLFKKGDLNGCTIVPYSCKFCGGWHVGHRGLSKRRVK